MNRHLIPHISQQYQNKNMQAKIKKMIQMNQDIGKLSNSIPHLLCNRYLFYYC
jgi:hypothetical protein